MGGPGGDVNHSPVTGPHHTGSVGGLLWCRDAHFQSADCFSYFLSELPLIHLINTLFVLVIVVTAASLTEIQTRNFEISKTKMLPKNR